MRAHDVRKLRLCHNCKALGSIDVFIKVGTTANYCGSCLCTAYTHAEVLAMPQAETKKLMLRDTGPILMRALIAKAIGEAA
jgi:hypothetical protein